MHLRIDALGRTQYAIGPRQFVAERLAGFPGRRALRGHDAQSLVRAGDGGAVCAGGVAGDGGAWALAAAETAISMQPSKIECFVSMRENGEPAWRFEQTTIPRRVQESTSMWG